MRNILQGVDARLLDLDTWPTVDEASLAPEKKESFRRRKCAVSNVAQSGNVSLAAEESGISLKEIRRIFRRCIKIHRDGRITGFRACVCYHRVKNYELKDETTTGSAGLLGRFFRNHPSIEKALIRFATSRRNSEITLPVGISDLSFKLLALCRDAKMAVTDYPLSAEESARKSLEKWYPRLVDSMGRAFLRAEFGEDAGRQYDDGLAAYVSPVDPHRIMVFDEWTPHAFTAVEISNPAGGTKWVPASRYKFVNGVRRGDRVVCACRPVLRKEPDVAEFLATVESAIRPHRRREFTIPTYAYPATPCFTSDVPGGEWLLPDLLYLDRSLVHLAAESRLAIARGLGAIIVWGPPRRPKARGDVEGLHSFFATKVRKFPTTTGANPKDPVRHEPEKGSGPTPIPSRPPGTVSGNASRRLLHKWEKIAEGAYADGSIPAVGGQFGEYIEAFAAESQRIFCSVGIDRARNDSLATKRAAGSQSFVSNTGSISVRGWPICALATKSSVDWCSTGKRLILGVCTRLKKMKNTS